MNADLPLSTTARTTLHRLSERGRSERADLYAVLDAGLICHLGVIIDGSPLVLPTGYGREGDVLYLHGSSGNQSMRAADGHEICVTITHVDGLVCARSLFNHSINYRSAAIFGTAQLIRDDARKLAALRVVTEQLAPGQWDYARQPNKKELAATAVLELPLAEASVKIRTGGPHDDAEDYELDVWAGVVPARLTFGPAEPDPDLRQGVHVPDHITALARNPRGSVA
jgi:uncharacterized protein